MVNFTACKSAFLNNRTNLVLYSYHGPVKYVKPGYHNFITWQGCEKLCGSGPDFYSWAISSDTILTWVLPMLVMFLLAPFEPNQKRKTALASIRWIGSPLISMWYILCNIQITGQMAQLVDMAVPYRCRPVEGSDYSEFRDAMTLLNCMNQYLPHPSLAGRAQGRGAMVVLRTALFSHIPLHDQTKSLGHRRAKLAFAVRNERRRGVVPILIGLMWYLFVLGISINFTFQRIGDVAAAHNLALGFAISWITPLVMGATVDRNPPGAERLRQKFNQVLYEVRQALLQSRQKSAVGERERTSPQSNLSSDDLNLLPDDFFVAFAGQGRVRWHNGVAFPILASIEENFAASRGRGWLDMQGARQALLPPPGWEPRWNTFDRHLLLPAIPAFAIIYGNLSAGFLISYFTPTVGLGCRSGGYLIFGILIMAATAGEVLLGVVASANSTLRRTGHLSLVMLELVNVCWLLWITIAQTFGIYRTCTCLSSAWGPGGGYIQFDEPGKNDSVTIVAVWSVATGVASAILMTSLVYFILQWCQQSHLMTLDYTEAQRSLMWTRRYKHIRSWVLVLPMFILNRITERLRRVFGKPARSSRMKWSP